MMISKAGRQYSSDVWAIVKSLGIKRPMAGELAVSFFAYPPDVRKRDLDNMLKAPLDAMQKAGLYSDDSQVARLLIERKRTRRPGVLIVSITEIDEPAKVSASETGGG